MTTLDDVEAARAVVDRLAGSTENSSPDDWQAACRFCVMHYPWLTKWELRFVVELYRNRVPPSCKQLTILENLVARCRNEAA